MAKNPTPWSNNDIKPPAGWVSAVKQKSAWANNITSHPAVFTPVAKQNTAWGLETITPTTYPYDSALLYDSSSRAYDMLVPATNFINSKIPTSWAVVV